MFSVNLLKVHQTTKSKKWECKLCGEKQSFKRFYGIGTAKECRIHVQKLNSLRGQLEETKNNTHENSNSSNCEEIVTTHSTNTYQPVKNSKWSNYVDEIEVVEDDNNLENMSLGERRVVLEIPTKRPKQSNDFKRNPGSTPLVAKNLENHTSSPVIVPNSLIISKVIKPKPSQASLHIETPVSIEEPVNKIMHSKFNKFVPPPLNKNSKWAQFADEPHEAEQTGSVAPLGTIDNQCADSKLTPQNDKFSWSDDTDIESILGI